MVVAGVGSVGREEQKVRVEYRWAKGKVRWELG